jgi:hypothetical protein
MVRFWAGLVVLSVCGSAQAGVLYSQPDDISGGGWNSQNDTTPVVGLGNFATSYDNFTLASDSTVRSVQWEGGYSYGNDFHVIGPMVAVDVTFWSDNGGEPGDPLQSEYISETHTRNLSVTRRISTFLIFRTCQLGTTGMSGIGTRRTRRIWAIYSCGWMFSVIAFP